jgi:hypothetical protein
MNIKTDVSVRRNHKLDYLEPSVITVSPEEKTTFLIPVAEKWPTENGVVGCVPVPV